MGHYRVGKTPGVQPANKEELMMSNTGVSFRGKMALNSLVLIGSNMLPA